MFFLFFIAIKTGRYTLEKRTKDIQEVKRLQQAEACPSPENWDHIQEIEYLICVIIKAHKIYGQDIMFDKEEINKRQTEYYVSVILIQFTYCFALTSIMYMQQIRGRC